MLTDQFAKQFKDQFQLCDQLIAISEKLPIRHSKPLTLYQRILLGFFAKVINGLRAITILCCEGRGVTALPLLRVLFEDAVHLGYISQSPEDRSLRYLEYNFVEKQLMLDDLEAVSYEDVDELKQEAKKSGWWKEYQRVKANYPDPLCWEHYIDEKGNRRGLKPFRMAKETGLLGTYRIVYPYASKVAHSTITGLSWYLTEQLNGDVILDIDPSEKEIEGLLAAAFGITVSVVKAAAREFALAEAVGFLEELDRKGRRLFLTSVSA